MRTAKAAICCLSLLLRLALSMACRLLLPLPRVRCRRAVPPSSSTTRLQTCLAQPGWRMRQVRSSSRIHAAAARAPACAPHESSRACLHGRGSCGSVQFIAALWPWSAHASRSRLSQAAMLAARAGTLKSAWSSGGAFIQFTQVAWWLSVWRLSSSRGANLCRRYDA